jgi:FkbM family methyltransferase
MLLDLVTPEKLIIVEPQPDGVREAAGDVRHRADVELHRIAIGDREGTTSFRVTRDTTGASVLPPREENARAGGAELDGRLADRGAADDARSAARRQGDFAAKDRRAGIREGCSRRCDGVLKRTISC